MPSDLTCADLVNLVTDYLEGAMPGPERERFDVHLKRCPPCEVYFVEFRQTIDLVGHLPSESISEQARAALMDAFRGWKESR